MALIIGLYFDISRFCSTKPDNNPLRMACFDILGLQYAQSSLLAAKFSFGLLSCSIESLLVMMQVHIRCGQSNN